MYRKNSVYIGFSTVCDFRHPLGVLEHTHTTDKGGWLQAEISNLWKAEKKRVHVALRTLGIQFCIMCICYYSNRKEHSFWKYSLIAWFFPDFMSGRTFIVKYFSKNRNWHSNKLPGHGHVNYTRTLLSKYLEAHIWKLLFNTVKININGTKNWSPRGRGRQGGEEEGKESVWCPWNVSSCRRLILLLFCL